MKKWLLFLLIPAIVFSLDNISAPYTAVPGASVSSSGWNSNIDTIINAVNRINDTVNALTATSGNQDDSITLLSNQIDTINDTLSYYKNIVNTHDDSISYLLLKVDSLSDTLSLYATFHDTGSFPCSLLTGSGPVITVDTAKYVKNGRSVTLDIPPMQSTGADGDGVSMYLCGIPASLLPNDSVVIGSVKGVTSPISIGIIDSGDVVASDVNVVSYQQTVGSYDTDIRIPYSFKLNVGADPTGYYGWNTHIYLKYMIAEQSNVESKHIQRLFLSPSKTELVYHPNASIVIVELDTTDAGFTVAMPELGANEHREFKFINAPQSGHGNDVILTARSIMHSFTQWTLHPYEGYTVIDNLKSTYLMMNAI